MESIYFHICISQSHTLTLPFSRFRNNEKLFPSERIRIEQETTGLLRLTIGGVGPEDVATYKCRIFNPHGEDSCTAQLIYDSEYK